MTPEERLAEQERLAYEEEKAEYENGGSSSGSEDYIEKKEFDKEQADREMQRASRSAQSCTGVVEGGPRGQLHVTVVFKPDGTVQTVTLGAPFAGSVLESCLDNAFEAIILPLWEGQSEQIEADIEIADHKVESTEKPATKKK